MVAHNAKFELAMFHNEGIQIDTEKLHDTQLMAYVLGYERTGLKGLSGRVLGVRQPTLKEWDLIDPVYPATDAACTMLLYAELGNRLVDNDLWDVYEGIERPLVPVLEDMERTGITLDKKKLADIGAYLEEKMLEIEKKLPNLTLTNRPQIEHYLYDTLKIPVPPGALGKTGIRSVAKAFLQTIDHPHAKLIFEWRQMNTLLTKYVRVLPAMQFEDGRVHCSFKQAGGHEDYGNTGEATATGRISCARPNLQQVPHRTRLGQWLRECIMPGDDYFFVKADISGEEARIGAYMSGDTRLVQQFADGIDPYLIIAEKLYTLCTNGDAESFKRNVIDGGLDVKKWRNPAKEFFLAALYGAQQKTYYDRGNCLATPEMDKSQGRYRAPLVRADIPWLGNVRKGST